MIPKRSPNKYHNRKVVIQGIEFDSTLEGYRYLYLKSAEKKGIIRNLRRQVEFEVIPKQTKTIEQVGKQGQPIKPKEVLLEHNTTYLADFTFEWNNGESWIEVVEDTKGFVTPEYVIKRKLMRLQGHPIQEIKSPAQVIKKI